MSKRSLQAGALLLAVLVTMAVMAPQAQDHSTDDAIAAVEPAPGTPAPSALDEALKRFEADSQPERALYLSALQAIEISRAQGDPEFAERLLTRIAGEAKRQSVRTSVRRLLVDLYMERGDYASAKTHLETIVQESLIQF